MRSGFPIIAVAICTLAPHAFAEDGADLLAKIQALHWIKPPLSMPVAKVAHIALPKDTQGLNSEDTDQFIQIQGNLPTPDEYAISSSNYQWFSLFSFDPAGYVKDDEQIDPAQLLSSLKEQNKSNVEEKKKAGLPLLFLDSWYIEPHYDIKSHRLEWGTRLHNEKNETVVNYSSRLLGRSGVMSATLVTDPSTFSQDLDSFHSLLDRFSFDAGQKYAEFREGDKIAAYGLGALVIGGAAAAAVKGSGAIFKGIAFLVAAIGAFFSWVKRLFTRKKQS